MNSASTGAVSRALPSWLQDVLLGYGDPGAAHFTSLPARSRVSDIDFGDTFLSAAHVVASFPEHQVAFRDEATGAPLDPAADAAAVQPPFRVRFESFPSPGGRGSGPDERVVVIPYMPPSPGPYPEDLPRRNTVPFTSKQVVAIRSGVNPGLTVIVGPPGTGKTDVAVQIISNLYHNFPNQVRGVGAGLGGGCQGQATSAVRDQPPPVIPTPTRSACS